MHAALFSLFLMSAIPNIAEPLASPVYNISSQVPTCKDWNK